jgi:hypothetical protein
MVQSHTGDEAKRRIKAGLSVAVEYVFGPGESRDGVLSAEFMGETAQQQAAGR